MKRKLVMAGLGGVLVLIAVLLLLSRNGKTGANRGGPGFVVTTQGTAVVLVRKDGYATFTVVADVAKSNSPSAKAVPKNR